MKKFFLLMISFLVAIPCVFAADNKLIFKEIDNKLYYETTNSANTFLDHRDMKPGKDYTDKLVLENASSKNFDLYFQIRPREQEKDPDDLLLNTKMEIYYDGTLLYSGNAKGLDVLSNGVDLTNTMIIGKFNAGDVKEMVVNLQLDSGWNKSYVESWIDWAFYVDWRENKEPEEVTEVPKTGDTVVRYIIVAIVFLLFIIGLIIYRRKSKE